MSWLAPPALSTLLGVLNGLAAAAALCTVYRAAPTELGWFAYAPLSDNENVVYDYYGSPWEYVVLPAVLLAVNVMLLPLVVRRGWLHR